MFLKALEIQGDAKAGSCVCSFQAVGSSCVGRGGLAQLLGTGLSPEGPQVVLVVGAGPPSRTRLPAP